jgi:hypothetical protein
LAPFRNPNTDVWLVFANFNWEQPGATGHHIIWVHVVVPDGDEQRDRVCVKFDLQFEYFEHAVGDMRECVFAFDAGGARLHVRRECRHVRTGDVAQSDLMPHRFVLAESI